MKSTPPELRPRGRPRTGRKPQLCVYVTPAEYVAMQDLARRAGVSLSTWCRDVLAKATREALA